jgi:metabotropic X receptor
VLTSDSSQRRCFFHQAFEELETLLAKYDICIAVKEKLVKDSGVADETAYDNIVQKLLTKPRARGEIN